MHHSEGAVAQHLHTLENEPVGQKEHRPQSKSHDPERSCGAGLR